MKKLALLSLVAIALLTACGGQVSTDATVQDSTVLELDSTQLVQDSVALDSANVKSDSTLTK